MPRYSESMRNPLRSCAVMIWKIVVLGNVEDVDEGFVDGVADDSPSLRRDGLGDVDADEGH